MADGAERRGDGTAGRIDVDRNIYAVAGRVAWANIGPCAAATVLLVATDLGAGYLYAPLAFAVLRALILIIVGYAAYRMLLSGGAISGFRAIATPDGRVPWRYAGVMLIILGPVLVLGVVWTAPGTGMGPSGLAEVVLGLVMVITYAALYILFGTALPEVAERGEVSLRDAFERGRANYRRIGRAMVFGPWLFRVASILVLIGLNVAGLQTDPYSLDARAFQPAGLPPLFAFKASHIFAELMTAVIMMRFYRRYRALPQDALAA
ncbi:MAG TPA: hypothetical protein VMM59_05920 [Thermohalobaculum sp.]|nr:hypothetical protein [Thermohalobaculum sp.]